MHRPLSSTFLASLGSLFALFAVVFGVAVAPTALAKIDNTPDCDTVAIIKCGAFSESKLKAAYDDNDYGDLKKVYDAFGISRSDMNGFVDGIVYRNGNVTVDGKVVATDAMTAGRNYGGTAINGTKNVGKYSVSKFVDEGQTAMVKMVNGTFSFAIVKACGNPVTAKPKAPPKPTYSCDAIEAKKISRSEYQFTASGSADNGAKITGYRFTFGDGNTTTSTSRTVSHTYAKAGNYTITVEVRVDIDGTTKYVDGNNCDTSIIVSPPPATPVYKCDQLTGQIIDTTKRTVQYSLTYTAEGGAALRNVDFNFGDGSSQNAVTPAQSQNVQHSYGREGSYTTTATLHFTVGNSVKDVNCTYALTINPNVCQYNPSLPATSPDCKKDCKPGIPEGDTRCQELPQEIIKTGPEQLAFGGIGLGSLTAAGYYWRASRRNLIKKLLGK